MTGSSEVQKIDNDLVWLLGLEATMDEIKQQIGEARGLLLQGIANPGVAGSYRVRVVPMLTEIRTKTASFASKASPTS